jgi:putative transposase
VSAKYEFIDAEKAHYPIVKMCAWAEVSTSGFYEWRDRPASATACRREELKLLIQAIFNDSDGTYGYRRVHAALARQGERCSPELVRALMRQLDLRACQPRPWRPRTTEAGDAGEVPDLVRRDFTAEQPGTKLVGDITYITTWEGWLYLATVLDCHTKACIGYAMAEHANRPGDRGVAHGRRQLPAGRGGDISFRSRLPVHFREIRQGRRRTRDTPVRGTHRSVFRQCPSGILQRRREG